MGYVERIWQNEKYLQNCSRKKLKGNNRGTCEDNINLLINRVWRCGLDSNGPEQNAVGLVMNLWVS